MNWINDSKQFSIYDTKSGFLLQEDFLSFILQEDGCKIILDQSNNNKESSSYTNDTK